MRLAKSTAKALNATAALTKASRDYDRVVIATTSALALAEAAAQQQQKKKRKDGTSDHTGKNVRNNSVSINKAECSS